MTANNGNDLENRLWAGADSLCHKPDQWNRLS